jgi:hypothetical protein
MSVLPSQSSPTVKVVHAIKGEGRAPKVPNVPFNERAELYATGSGVSRGWMAPIVDKQGGMQVTIGNAEFFDSSAAVRLWNHSKNRAQVVEIAVRPVTYCVNGRSELLVSRYLTAAEVQRLGFASGDLLAMQLTVRRKGEPLPAVTVSPVYLEHEVLPSAAR